VNEHDEIVQVIPREEALNMSTDDILAKFEFDHGVYVAAPFCGTNHPTNLTPRLKEKHREKTKRDRKEIAKTKRGVKKRQAKSRAGKFCELCPNESWCADADCLYGPRLMTKRRKPRAQMPYTRLKVTHKRTFDGRTVAR
jgi:hypothetical protein